KSEDIANQEVKDKVDGILAKLPSGAETPTIAKFEIGADAVVQLAFISSLSPSDAYRFVDQKIKDRLARLNGVAQIDITGGQEREIHIILNAVNLQKYDISPLQVVGFIQQNNMSLPSGSIKQHGSEYSVRYQGEFETIEDIENIRIVTPKGERNLGEIARIVDSSEKLEKIGRFFNRSSASSDMQPNATVINIGVIKQSSANEVDVAEQVVAEVAQINAELPSGTRIDIGDDNSIFTKESVEDTMSAIYLGVLFTAVILYIFLHSIRTTFVVAISMPIVLIATFLLVNGSGFSLNLMTLMALSVSVGTLVTNSVIIIENIDRYIRLGMKRFEASEKGTAEIAVAVIASTLTNIVVFVPIATMQSLVGQIFKEFGLTVVFIMIFSILVSFTVTPMLSSQLLRDEKRKWRGFSRWFENVFNIINSLYHKILTWLVSHWSLRVGLTVISIGLLIVSILHIAPYLGSEFVPYVDAGKIRISVELPPFYEISRTSSVFKEIEKRIRSHEDVEKMIVNIGVLGNSSGPYMGQIEIRLKEDRSISTRDMATTISYELADIPDALIKVSPISKFTGRPGVFPIEIEILGTDMEKIRELTVQVYEITKNIEGPINVDTDIRPGKPEIRIVPKRTMIADLNTNGYTIALTLRASVEGLIASQYRVEGEEYDIRVKLEDADVEDIEKIKSLIVQTPKGNKRISELADLEFCEAPTMIYRKDKLRMQKVTADVGSRTVGEILTDIMQEVNTKIDVPPQYKIQPGGDAEIQADANRDLNQAFLLAAILTYFLIVAILESWLQGLLILFTVPLAMIGVLWSLYLSGESMNIFSMMAMIMLIGIVVNNAILILDYANQLRKVGHNKKQAILEACPTKLKAVIMATLASILGMLPLALGFGSGAELRQGMGIVSIGGLLLSSILTLFVIPALYVQFVKEKK
ncbi:efflux RND transporter permease subunit, partial [bacterium]|nr:efflux RND transporter permease subunit [candidate division CSSED10-310 bacterium]